MTTDLASQTRGLTKFSGHQRGIEDLDLDVRRGEVFGFLGPNGGGLTEHAVRQISLDFPGPPPLDELRRTVALVGLAVLAFDRRDVSS